MPHFFCNRSSWYSENLGVNSVWFRRDLLSWYRGGFRHVRNFVQLGFDLEEIAANITTESRQNCINMALSKGSLQVTPIPKHCGIIRLSGFHLTVEINPRLLWFKLDYCVLWLAKLAPLFQSMRKQNLNQSWLARTRFPALGANYICF